MAHTPRTHPGITGNGSWLPSMCCNAAFTIEYKGASAHAGAMPSAGVNALDAAVSGYTNVALLRQQIPDTHRIYNVLKGSEGWTANSEWGRSWAWYASLTTLGVPQSSRPTPKSCAASAPRPRARSTR